MNDQMTNTQIGAQAQVNNLSNFMQKDELETWFVKRIIVDIAFQTELELIEDQEQAKDIAFQTELGLFWF